MDSLTSARPAPAAGTRGIALAVLGVLALTVFAGGLGAATQEDQAAEPAAIVEDIDAASVTDVAFMDFLYEGMEIKLQENETLTLSYLTSCRIEEITGAAVRIGRAKSEATGPVPMVVTMVDCDGGGIQPTERQGEGGAVTVFRDVGKESPVRVNSTTPLFAFDEPVEELVIERVDREAEALKIAVGGTRLDLAKENLALDRGAIYRATAAGQSVLLRVEANASRHDNSLVERLIAF